jgi:hypothetical protein
MNQSYLDGLRTSAQLMVDRGFGARWLFEVSGRMVSIWGEVDGQPLQRVMSGVFGDDTPGDVAGGAAALGAVGSFADYIDQIKPETVICMLDWFDARDKARLLPKIGHQWYGAAAVYGGLMAGDAGDYHLVVSYETGFSSRAMAVQRAGQLARVSDCDFGLPSCREMAMLKLCLPVALLDGAHWTSDVSSAGGIWVFCGATGTVPLFPPGCGPENCHALYVARVPVSAYACRMGKGGGHA